MERKMKRASVKICFIVVLAFVASLVIAQGVVWAQPKPVALVDINSASVKDLESLPGVGPVIAKKIVANRPYKTVDELTKAGLSKRAIDKLRPMVTVGSAVPAAAPTTAAPKASAPAARAKTAAEKTAATKLAPGQKVNINTATKDQLIALPGIGPAKAQAIIDGRPYKAPEDVMKVKGIKQGVYNKIKDYITVQ